MHNFGEEKNETTVNLMNNSQRKYTSNSTEKNVISSEYDKLSRSSLTCAMKSILIKLCLHLL